MSDLSAAIARTTTSGRIPAFAYDRVSSEKQADTGNSLQYQGDNARAYADRAGLEIVQSFSAAESAFKEGRVIFNRMLDLAMRHGVKDIIFKNTDRLGRNDIDWPRCKALARTKGLRVHLYELGIVFNAESTAEEEMFLDNTSTMAKYWSNKISQSLKKSYEWKAKQGIPPARFPVGYLWDREKQVHYIDPKYSDMMHFIFDTFDAGDVGLLRLVEILNEKGYRTPTGRPWRWGYLEKVLKNPLYAGFFIYRGIEYQAHHESYFTRARFDKRIALFSSRRVSQRKRTVDYPLSGLVRSGVSGRVLTGEMKKGRYIYYSHRNPEIYFKQEKIFGMLDAVIRELSFTDDFDALLRRAFKESVSRKLKTHTARRRIISAQIGKLESRQAKLLDLFGDGDIDRDALKSKLRDVRLEINRLQEQQQAGNVDKEKVLLSISEALDNLRELPYWYAQGTPEEKADVVRALARRVYVFDDHVELEYRPVFQELIEGRILQYRHEAAIITSKVRKSKRMRARVATFRTAVDAVTDAMILRHAA